MAIVLQVYRQKAQPLGPRHAGVVLYGAGQFLPFLL